MRRNIREYFRPHFKYVLKTSAALALCIISLSSTLEAAPAQGLLGPCQITDEITKINLSRQPSVAVSKNVSAGDPISLNWSVPKPPQDNASYLIFGFPEATRFRGDGFIALLPNARAPHSLRSRREETRLVVPLTGDLANLRGIATVTFFESGARQIHWAIVDVEPTGQSHCRERIISFGAISVEIGLGKPQIFTQDVFNDDQPMATYVSNDNRFYLREYANRYEVVRSDNGGLLFEHAGQSPRFSHGGDL
jgi:hypothetical protein